jgi:hypothetical protein
MVTIILFVPGLSLRYGVDGEPRSVDQKSFIGVVLFKEYKPLPG